jgi:antitoxin ParD1/3/4
MTSKSTFPRRRTQVADLMRADEKCKAEEELEAKLLEGLKSPESELTPAAARAIRKEALARLQTKKLNR